MITCTCPKAQLDTIPYDSCRLIFDKDARWFFQRIDDATNTFVDGVNAIATESSWTALPDATNSTKVTVTPYLEEVVFGDEDKLTDGENFDGAANFVAMGPQSVTATIRNPTAAEFSALKGLECEPGIVGFYRVDSNSNIIARQTASSPNTYAAFPISFNTIGISDPAKAGAKTDQNKMIIQFDLAEGWFAGAAQVAPDAGFNPLTDVFPTP